MKQHSSTWPIASLLGLAILLAGCTATTKPNIGPSTSPVADGGCPHKHELKVGAANTPFGHIILMPYGKVTLKLVDVEPSVPLQITLTYWQKSFGALNDTGQAVSIAPGQVYTVSGKWAGLQMTTLAGGGNPVVTFCSDQDWEG
jgi:hypothetical protein